MSEKPARRGEFELIAKYFAPLSKGEPGALNLTDDAVSLKPRAGHDFVLTTDAVIAGVHFLADDPPDTVAQKALRVNLSDLAAKGATPRAYLLTLALPHMIDEAWVKAFAAGLKRDQTRFGVTLAGGDTTATPGALVVSITALGEVAHGKMLTRSGAKPGDDVWVTGTIGDAALGLKVLKGDAPRLSSAQQRALILRYRVPEPRVSIGVRLLGLAHAAIDVSDGLIADLGHICDVSGAGMEIAVRQVPLSAAAKAAVSEGVDLAELISGGDDYEIAFTAPAAARTRLLALSGEVEVSRIGTVVKGRRVSFLDGAGRALRIGRAGYTHF